MLLREIPPKDRIFRIREVEIEHRAHPTQERVALAACTSRRAQSRLYSLPGLTSLCDNFLQASDGALKELEHGM